MKFSHFCSFLAILTLFRPVFISVYIWCIYISGVFLYIAYIQILYTFTVRTRHFYKNKKHVFDQNFQNIKNTFRCRCHYEKYVFSSSENERYFFVFLCNFMSLFDTFKIAHGFYTSNSCIFDENAKIS